MKRKLIEVEHLSQQHRDHLMKHQRSAIKNARRSHSHNLTDMIQIETAFKQLSFEETEHGHHCGICSTFIEAELVSHNKHAEEVSQMHID